MAQLQYRWRDMMRFSQSRGNELLDTRIYDSITLDLLFVFTGEAQEDGKIHDLHIFP